MSSRYDKMKWRQCGVIFLLDIGNPNSRKYSFKFEKLIFKLGFNLEFECKVHYGLCWTSSFLNPRVNMP